MIMVLDQRPPPAATRMHARLLAGGRRLHLQDGPIDLIIEADGSDSGRSAAFKAAERRFSGLLDELCAELSLLRRPVGTSEPNPRGVVARRMTEACRALAADRFITPMAAVAGAVAEEILAAMLAEAPLERAFVNNGGDIAFHLAPGAAYNIGMIDRPDQPALFGRLRIGHDHPVRGIATSGWRGRSFSLGIADAITVLARNAAGADAAATLIANEVDLPGHAAITRVPARDLKPDSDLQSQLVTCAVGPLSPGEILVALGHGAHYAEQLLRAGFIVAAALHLQDETRLVGAGPLLVGVEGEPVHASC
jgi:hypothetical protein